MSRPMSRAAIAVPVGIVGFVLYVALAVVLADRVLGMHWTVQALYFLAAGVLWAWPAHHLMLWAGRGRRR
ncbi:DUF2842 domain-containing protein [Roseomonas sp. NAR14]|uniref:DUF2842 domain-containing protein n=1 Tax=Roseomonas acroporae TaxID=2937791 RepID=A0A9X1YC99_9PROT|nr:DUF2842 domain-containing protein [Roseomonas acroporae]MCK8786365.1 DUF2842 domain-containing protein [Roseomonas acroporae]